ncbi:hypothetical protein [Actinoplanes sp. NPDC051851]|uniref:anti-sigma factor family protein n=1 Tax=Actinoplanes sp. NPDC051851 TaxID=3154753 RepID=UPI003417924D
MTELDAEHAELETCVLYLSGRMDPEAVEAFERHLGRCVICVEECDTLGPLASILADMPPEFVAAFAELSDPAPVSPAPLPAVPTAGSGWRPGWRWWSLAAGGLAAIGVLWVVLDLMSVHGAAG